MQIARLLVEPGFQVHASVHFLLCWLVSCRGADAQVEEITFSINFFLFDPMSRCHCLRLSSAARESMRNSWCAELEAFFMIAVSVERASGG